MNDWRTAPVDEATRSILGLLEKMTLRPDDFSPADFQVARDAGVRDEAIVDALYVCALFNIADRLADAFDFAIPDQEGFNATANMLLRIGYLMPPPVVWFSRD
jgi:alkylhydroperoxidase family enzyme